MAAPQQHLPCKGIKNSKAYKTFVSGHWEWENTKHSCFAQYCGGQQGLVFPGNEVMAELEIANTTFVIQSVNVTPGHWKQVMEPCGKQLEFPFRLQAFASVKEKKELMRSPAQGISLCGSFLQDYVRNAFSDGVLPFVTCVNFVFGSKDN